MKKIMENDPVRGSEGSQLASAFNGMRYVFFGGQDSPFAQIILDGLKSAGWQPIREIRDARAPLNIDGLKSCRADFFLVAAFGKILKKEILEIPPKGTIGVHPSLLPRLRGPSPIQSVLLNDEQETGITLFLIDEKVDHGPIVSSVKCQVPSKDTYEKLQIKLAELSADLILEIVPKWLNGEIKPQIQNESEATYTKKFTSEDAKVSLNQDDQKQIWLKIRALNPEPGVFTILELKNGKKMRLKLLEADYQAGGLKLKTVQPEGKKVMTYQDFLNGHKNFLVL